MGIGSDATRRAVAERTAPLMFWLALLYLAILATLIIVLVDVPRLSPLADVWDVEEAGGAVSLGWGDLYRSDPWNLERLAGALGSVLLLALALLWPVFPLEFAVQFFLRDRSQPFWARRYRGLLVCVFPPFRLGIGTATGTTRSGSRFWVGRKSAPNFGIGSRKYSAVR